MGRSNSSVQKLHEKKKNIENAVRIARENQVKFFNLFKKGIFFIKFFYRNLVICHQIVKFNLITKSIKILQKNLYI